MDRALYPEPTVPRTTRDYYLDALAYSRQAVAAKVQSLPGAAQNTFLPSGWTPLALVKHLTFVEMRWLEWGFEGVAKDAPFADRVDGVFTTEPNDTFEALASALVERGSVTRSIIASHELSDVGQPSDRWDGAEPPTLEQVLQHLTYEYARHLGHLDIVVELATGEVGE